MGKSQYATVHRSSKGRPSNQQIQEVDLQDIVEALAKVYVVKSVIKDLTMYVK